MRTAATDVGGVLAVGIGPSGGMRRLQLVDSDDRAGGQRISSSSGEAQRTVVWIQSPVRARLFNRGDEGVSRGLQTGGSAMARDLEREPERRPATASDGEAPAVAEAPGAGVSRRTLLGSGFALAASAGLLEAGGARADALPDARAGSLQRASAHTLFRLPQDHKWHAGGIYATGQLEEWYYWTGFLTDAATKEQFGLFYNLFHEGSAPGKVGYRVWFALYNLDKN